MTLKDQMTSDLSVFFNTDEFAENVVYTAKDEFPVTIPVIPADEEDIVGTESSVEEMRIEVKASDVPDPTYRDTFEVEGVTWYYAETEKKDDYTKILKLTRKERPTFRR